IAGKASINIKAKIKSPKVSVSSQNFHQYLNPARAPTLNEGLCLSRSRIEKTNAPAAQLLTKIAINTRTNITKAATKSIINQVCEEIAEGSIAPSTLLVCSVDFSELGSPILKLFGFKEPMPVTPPDKKPKSQSTLLCQAISNDFFIRAEKSINLSINQTFNTCKQV